MAAARALRSPLDVTLAVWKALFLREALSRLLQDRIAWVWLVLEPVAHIAVILWFYAVGLRVRFIGGADVGVIIMLGIFGFFMPRNILNRSIDAIDAGESLYAFRQIKPVDMVVARAALEGLLECVIFLTLFTGAGMLGYPVFPADPLRAIVAIAGLWLAGFGLGLTFSVLGGLTAELTRVVRLLITPAYLFSCALHPAIAVQRPLREILLLNPIVHGIEALRVAFFPLYQVPPGISLVFLYEFGLVMVFTGLALHIFFQSKLMTK